MFKQISSVVLYEVKEKAQVQPGGLHSGGGGETFSGGFRLHGPERLFGGTRASENLSSCKKNKAKN